MENLLDEFEPNFENSIDLVKEIEEMRVKSKLNYIECVVEVCSKFDLDIEAVCADLPKNIKEKIEADALELNLLNYTINTLF